MIDLPKNTKSFIDKIVKWSEGILDEEVLTKIYEKILKDPFIQTDEQFHNDEERRKYSHQVFMVRIRRGIETLFNKIAEEDAGNRTISRWKD